MFDISTSRTGLPCRVDDCHVSFAPKSSDSVADLEDAILKRDAHELHVHGYEHRPVVLPKWGYGNMKGRLSR